MWTWSNLYLIRVRDTKIFEFLLIVVYVYIYIIYMVYILYVVYIKYICGVYIHTHTHTHIYIYIYTYVVYIKYICGVCVCIKSLRLAFSLSIIPLRSVQVVTGINHLFLFISIVIHGMNVPQFDHSCAEGCFSVFGYYKKWCIMTFVFQDSVNHKFPFLYDNCLKVRLLSYKVSIYLVV